MARLPAASFRTKVAFSVLLVVLIFPLQCKKSKYADSPHKAIPEFEVYRATGTTPLSRDIPGSGVAILFFGYRGCPDICSGALRRIGQAHVMLSAQNQQLARTIFVEVGQTPLIEAAAYARTFDSSIGVAADPNGRITQALGIYVHPLEDARPVRIEHSGTIILVDHNLISRKRLPHDISAEELAHEIEILLEKDK